MIIERKRTMQSSFEKSVIKEVFIDVLAVLKIMKHCNGKLPHLVNGILYGIENGDTLDISFVHPFVESKASEDSEEDNEFQAKLLQQNCPDSVRSGWYQSLHLGDIFTSEVVSCQFSYQTIEESSINSILIVYDPFQSTRGNIVMKAFRLSSKYIAMKKLNKMEYFHPRDVFEEIPLQIKSVGYSSLFLRGLEDTHRSQIGYSFSSTSMSTSNAEIERLMELLSNHLDEVTKEQNGILSFSKTQRTQLKNYKKKDMEEAERLKSLTTGLQNALLDIGQLNLYCDQMNHLVNANSENLIVTNNIRTL